MESGVKEEIEKVFGETRPVELVEREMYLIKKAQIDKLQFNSSKKYVLGHRVVVLRKLAWTLHSGKLGKLGHIQYGKRVEAWLDRFLIEEQYDLEKCIGLLRKRVSVIW